MLYLIKLDSAYKIGFTDDLKSRVGSYRVSNINVELIASRIGGREEEKEIHSLLRNYLLRGELYELSDDIIQLFNTYVYNPDREKDKLIETLQKDNAKLKESIKYLYGLLSPKFKEVIFEIEKEIIFRGNITKYIIKYYDNYISFGNCLIYNIDENSFVNEYGKVAKIYNISGENMYYILPGIALKTNDVNKNINELLDIRMIEDVKQLIQ